MKLYKFISFVIDFINNCNDTRYQSVIDNYIIPKLPSGNGIDNGCKINLKQSKPLKIIIDSSYHVMNESGIYDRWIDFKIIVTPSFDNIDINIRGNFGSKYQHLKDYLIEIFQDSLSKEIDKISGILEDIENEQNQ